MFFFPSKCKVSLTSFKSRHALDIHLSSHIHDLTTLIRDRALVLYFQPFTSVRFSKIASAFGLPESEVEQHVVGLIRSGDIKGRVDSQNKVHSTSFTRSFVMTDPFKDFEGSRDRRKSCAICSRRPSRYTNGCDEQEVAPSYAFVRPFSLH